MSRGENESPRTRRGAAVIRLPRNNSVHDEAKGLRFLLCIVAFAVLIPALAMVASGRTLPTPPAPVLVIVILLLAGVISLAIFMSRRMRWSEIDFARGEARIDDDARCALRDVVALAWIDTVSAIQVGQLEAPPVHVHEERCDLLFITRDADPEVLRALASAQERWNTMQSPMPLGLNDSSLAESLAADRPGVVPIAFAISKPAAARVRSRLADEISVPVFERGAGGRWTLLPS